MKKYKLRLQKEFPEARIRDNPTGMFYTKNGTPIKVNRPGTPDLELRLPTKNGLIILEYEIKTGESKQSKVQKTWQKNTESMNGFYLVVRDDFDSAIAETKKYLKRTKALRP